MKRLIAAICIALLLLSMTACEGKKQQFTIGICQIQPHAALDAATKGFKDAVIKALGEENVKFLEKNAAGEFTNCGTIMDGFVAEDVDLILANATPPLQAASSATGEIPILGTSVTDYATALNISNWNGTVGGNISGTTDLAPLDEQAQMILDLFPDAKKVGLLYCSAEPNSVYQITQVQTYLEGKGVTCERYAFNDANDLNAVAETACGASDVVYVPTDNTAATYAEAIGNIALAAKRPIICGEANTCAKCGVATLSIDYYDLGYVTGEMAVKILKGEADIGTMAVQSAPNFTKMYNKEICDALGIEVPEGYVAIGE